MQKRLNDKTVHEAMAKAGLSQTAVAQALGVSREAVSQWLNNKAFPRPDKLVRLGKMLNLKLDDLVIRQESHPPRIAFRKMKGRKTTVHHIQKAQEMGRMLRHLVPFLPFDILEMPPVLKTPNCDYEYLEKVARKTRHDINIGLTETIDFRHLIRRFNELQTVLIPVPWGSKDRHENAVHIYLPDSQTTWVYLNLDVNIHDFKFWMAHELGHCLSPTLDGDEAEDFADAFAGTLLFPHEKAKTAYAELQTRKTIKSRFDLLFQIAEKEVISPYTIFKQVNRYAEFSDQKLVTLGSNYYGAITNFNKKFQNLSDGLLSGKSSIDARNYIQITENVFETPFFALLRQYLKEHGKGPGYIQAVLNVSPLDARSLHAELT